MHDPSRIVSALVPVSSVEALRELARRRDRSFSAELRVAIQHHVASERRRQVDQRETA